MQQWMQQQRLLQRRRKFLTSRRRHCLKSCKSMQAKSQIMFFNFNTFLNSRKAKKKNKSKMRTDMQNAIYKNNFLKYRRACKILHSRTRT